MNVSIRFLTAAAMAIVLAGSASALDKPKPEPVGGKIEWTYDYEQGKRLSKTSGKPMFVVFRCER